jgi:Mn-containing catalase
MKDMLNFLIARDTMHQQQWLAVLEELGPEQATNAPGDYENVPEHQDVAYAFFNHLMDEHLPTDARWTSGKSLDGKGQFTLEEPARPRGQEPQLQKAPPEVHAGAEATDPDAASAAARFTRVIGSAVDKVTRSSR